LSLCCRALKGLLQLPVVACPQLSGDRARIESRVPDIEVAHRCEMPHRLAVRPHDFEHGLGSLGLAEVPLPRSHLEAGCETLDVPLERARQRLVEIVEVEDEVAFRRGEAAEIGEVRVAESWAESPDRGAGARSCAITTAAPRKKANGETSMRP
jgi:hypothetical protein